MRREREIQVLRKNIGEIRHAKCQKMEIMPCLFPHYTMPTTTSTAYKTTHNNTQLLTPHPNYVLNRETSFINYYEQENNIADSRTLNLFPLKRDDSQEEDNICLPQN